MDIEIAFQQALDYLYSFVDYSLKKSSELARAEFDLERMRDLLERLGSPHRRYPSLHVAGTKGKGSTCALMASALTAAGYRTGLYISPHLQDYTERIQVDGVPIPHALLVDLVEAVKPHVAAVPRLTTFEITTALGLWYFAREGVDAAVIEVGLGGRLDATNIISPQVSVITSLSYDHLAVLGDTLAQIAGEKAGIIKDGIPVVSAPQKEEALAVIQRVAAERKAPLTLVGREVTYSRGNQSMDSQTLTILDHRPGGGEELEFSIPLLGEHQVINAATAYAGLRASGLSLHNADVQRGFSQVNWQCRFEIASRHPALVLDSAHNQESFERLAQTLAEVFPGKKVILVFGASEDKDMPAMLATLQGRLKMILATRADHPRAVDPQAIIAAAASLGIPAEAAAPPAVALVRALQLAAQGGQLVVSAGSMFVTAEVKTAWQKLNQGRGEHPR